MTQRSPKLATEPLHRATFTRLWDLAGHGPIAFSALIGRIVELGFEWGMSDGT